ncbi:Uma2 family endonuclease [Tsukamurella sp. NPDC003166]|uniref:Uma2 family endonuclease n=1 Tax=Tsukamurella sp. NPDC003166 TaxID=3154444 RepID=UPI0033A9BAF8
MTAASDPPLLSFEQWCALGEDIDTRTELVRGELIVLPRPRTDHQTAIAELLFQFRSQLPPGLRAYPEIDVVLDSGPRPTVRVPDIAVGAYPPPAQLAIAAHMVLVVEILSRSTSRTDRVAKRAEYARAGIPHYWIVDLDAQEVEAMTLVDGAYTSAVAHNEFATTAPFAVRIDLTALV